MIARESKRGGSWRGLAAVAVLAVASPASAAPHAGQVAAITIVGATVRASIPGSPNSTGYLTLTPPPSPTR